MFNWECSFLKAIPRSGGGGEIEEFWAQTKKLQPKFSQYEVNYLSLLKAHILMERRKGYEWKSLYLLMRRGGKWLLDNKKFAGLKALLGRIFCNSRQ